MTHRERALKAEHHRILSHVRCLVGVVAAMITELRDGMSLHGYFMTIGDIQRSLGYGNEERKRASGYLVNRPEGKKNGILAMPANGEQCLKMTTTAEFS